jgi:hypothetical protein
MIWFEGRVLKLCSLVLQTESSQYSVCLLHVTTRVYQASPPAAVFKFTVQKSPLRVRLVVGGHKRDRST